MTNELISRNKRERNLDVLLVEYQAAQASAEHHINLVWQATNILWAANIVLIGLVLNVINNRDLHSFIAAISIFGVLVAAFIAQFSLRFRGIAVKKYARCKEIERILGMSQHLSVSQRGGVYIYAVTIVAFLALWLKILYYVS